MADIIEEEKGADASQTLQASETPGATQVAAVEFI